jgi:hypothetical protein
MDWVTVFHFLKVSEGGPGVAFFVRELRRAGIRARSTYSPYVGHVGLDIGAGEVTKAKRALAKLGCKI